MGRGALRNKPCKCGSNNKYSECCYNLTDEEVNTKIRRMYYEKAIKEANIKLCLYPDGSECDERIIPAHSIQNNKILNKLSEEGYILMMKSTFSNPNRFELQRIGRGKATTFSGFCGKHDKKIFQPIEDTAYSPNNEEQNCLFAFRAFCKVWHDRLVNIRYLENFPVKDNDIIELIKAHEAALVDIESDLEIFKEMLFSLKYDQLETKNIYFDKECQFAVSSVMHLPHDFEGNELPHFTKLKWLNPKPLFITIFPQKGQTQVILTYPKEHKNIFSFLEKQLIEKDKSEQEELLSRMVLYNCENIVFSPKLITQKGTSYKKLLEDKFIDTAKLYIDEPQLNKDIGLSLFE